MVMKNYQIIIILLLLMAFFLSRCNIIYFIPPKKSVLEFSINNYSGKWRSQGFEAVGDERCIAFYSKEKPDNFSGDYLHLWLKEPVKRKLFTENDSRIDFMTSQDDDYGKSLFNSKDLRTKIFINLKEWSNKPRGLIEGNIEATLYDFEGKKYEMKGHFKVRHD